MLDTVSIPPLADRARHALLMQPALPQPGGGNTLQRWRALARLGAEDLCLAKVLEAHYDAAAILHDLGAPAPADGTLWAVWAAEGPACTAMPEAGPLQIGIAPPHRLRQRSVETDGGGTDSGHACCWPRIGVQRLPIRSGNAVQLRCIGRANRHQGGIDEHAARTPRLVAMQAVERIGAHGAGRALGRPHRP